jgi:excisionase family DNA binding protein
MVPSRVRVSGPFGAFDILSWLNAMLYPVSTIARYLHVKREAVIRMIEEDGLPAVRIPTRTKHVRKVPLRPFHAWLFQGSENTPTPLEDLRADLSLLDCNPDRSL